MEIKTETETGGQATEVMQAAPAVSAPVPEPQHAASVAAEPVVAGRAETGPKLATYVTLLVALVILGGTAVMLYTLKLASGTAKDVTEFFQPKFEYKSVLSGSIGKLNSNPKLVVLTVPVTATSTIESTRTIARLPYGSATVEVSAPAKIQYYLNLKDLTMDDFEYDEAGKRLVVTIPKPILDTDVVDIESDPAKVRVRTETGWSPLSGYVAGIALDKAKANMREAALEQGRHELVSEKAEKNAKITVSELLGKVKDAISKDGVTLEVEFKK